MTITQRTLTALHRGKLGSAPLSCPCCGEDPPPAHIKNCGTPNQHFTVGCENPDCFLQPLETGKTLAEAWGRWHHLVTQ